MEKTYLLHMLTTAKNLSPFDVTMAIDSGWVSTVPYINVDPSEVSVLIQDIIFSRSPKALKKTGVFIGGRSSKQAMDMLKIAKHSMVPPFEVSIFADPSGAFTTAAGMVAAVENELDKKFNSTLKGINLLTLGGTGPVGQIASVLAAKAGANVRIIGRQLRKVESIVELCNEEFGNEEINIKAGIDAEKSAYMKNIDVIFSTGAAGIELLNTDLLQSAIQLKVVADINAVPPSGISGVGAFDNGKKIVGSLNGAVGLGAMVIGNIKYHTQIMLLQKILEHDKPVYLHFEHAFVMAREYIKSAN